jgi:hypothetical protein
MPCPDLRPSHQSARLTTGLKWAPDTGPKIRISTASASMVATEFSSNSNPTSAGLSRAAMMPEPTTADTVHKGR